ncbi:MAG: hypothetical protein ACFE96_18450, partial [Candidatus Hermodarchaeota archaeon]
MAKKKAPQKAPASQATAVKKPAAPKAKTLSLGTDQKLDKKQIEKIRFPAEELHKEELMALAQNDTYPKPPNWLLSPKMVELFITGSDEEFKVKLNGSEKKLKITTKFYGQRDLIQKSIVTLASERAL